MWFLEIQFSEKEWKPTGIFPQCKQKCVFWTFYFSKKSVKSMSISEMCKFVSFNNLSLYIGERENRYQLCIWNIRAFYFRKGTDTNRLQFKHRGMKCLIHQPSIASQQFKLRIRIRWYVWYHSWISLHPFFLKRGFRINYFFITARFALRPLYDCTRNSHSQ